jgi:hypothetical protein
LIGKHGRGRSTGFIEQTIKELSRGELLAPTADILDIQGILLDKDYPESVFVMFVDFRLLEPIQLYDDHILGR